MLSSVTRPNFLAWLAIHETHRSGRHHLSFGFKGYQIQPNTRPYTKYNQIQGQTFLLDLQSMIHMEWMRQFIWPQYLLWLQIHWDSKRERKCMPHIEVVETIWPQKQPFPTMQQTVTLEWINKMFNYTRNVDVEITITLIKQCWLEPKEYHFNTVNILIKTK